LNLSSTFFKVTIPLKPFSGRQNHFPSDKVVQVWEKLFPQQQHLENKEGLRDWVEFSFVRRKIISKKLQFHLQTIWKRERKKKRIMIKNRTKKNYCVTTAPKVQIKLIVETNNLEFQKSLKCLGPLDHIIFFLLNF